VRYTLGAGVRRAVAAAYELQPGDPLVRPLRIFTTDPSASKLEGRTACALVPYEPVQPGPIGMLFEVSGRDSRTGTVYAADLNKHSVMLSDGYDPSDSNPAFLQQMVYAVASLVHASFRRALGRQLGWTFAGPDRPGRLVIHPFGMNEGNAWYDPEKGELRFGYFQATRRKVSGRTLPSSTVFTALSHDVVAHELSHAVLDGLRPLYLFASGGDMAAFHEAFADLIALFHHYEYRDALRNALDQARGDLAAAPYLVEIAQQFGRAGGGDAPLRRALPAEGKRLNYDERLEEHDLGEILVQAVYEAFVTVYRRKTLRYVKLATGGTGVLTEGALSPYLIDQLTDEAMILAREFLNMIIRAVDYCPPCDLRFGEFLRAVITSDREVSPEDEYGYREALIDAFRERGIYPRAVASLNEDSLLWSGPRIEVPAIGGLSFAELRFDGDPGRAAGVEEQCRQACTLGEHVTAPEYLNEFGLVASGDSRIRGATVGLPQIESIRTVRRVGRDGRIRFDTVAEVSQLCSVRGRKGQAGFEYYGGATIVIGPRGEVRYIISKSVVGAGRLERRRKFLESRFGGKYWHVRRNRYVPRGSIYRRLHERPDDGPPSRPDDGRSGRPDDGRDGRPDD
jgi:hypothetical protein